MKFAKIFFIILILIIGLIQSQRVEAHVLQTDGNIGAVLHIDPDDDPIALSQSSFFWEFKDKEGKFHPQNCDCTFSIIEDGKQIYTQPLFQNNPNPSLTSASVFFTFPEKNVYQVKVVGNPLIPNAFQPFTLVYDVRVARIDADPANQSQTGTSWFSSHLPHLILGIIILIFVIIALIKKVVDNKRKVVR